jgi:DNA-binding NarL/FixJ family response regulator
VSREGLLDGDAVERVLVAAGHRRAPSPGRSNGLTDREAQVLRLVALGLTNREVGEQLGITTKTAGHHVQHIYTKIGVSTRGAATLFAVENGILATDA